MFMTAGKAIAALVEYLRRAVVCMQAHAPRAPTASFQMAAAAPPQAPITHLRHHHPRLTLVLPRLQATITARQQHRNTRLPALVRIMILRSI